METNSLFNDILMQYYLGMPLFDGDQDLQPYLSLIKKPDDAHEVMTRYDVIVTS